MNRMKRWTLRLSLLLVIIAGVAGGWAFAGAWEVNPNDMAGLSTGNSADWAEILATIAEEAIQLFFGFTSN